MYYLLYLLLLVLLYYFIFKVLGSIVKGCFTFVIILAIALIGFNMIKSTKEPIDVFGIYKIENFVITRK